MSDFRGGGGSKKIGFYKVKIGGGVKNDSKKSDIIYEWSLMFLQWICKGIFSKKQIENRFVEKAGEIKKVGRPWDEWCVSYYSNLPHSEICKLVHTMG